MAREKNHVRLGRYQAEIDRARDFRSQEGYDDLWNRMRDLYRGRHYASNANDGQTKRLVVNMAFATKNVIAPSVAVNNPRFTVMARRPEQAPHSVITQEILNYMWRTHKFQKQFRLAVDDMLIFGHGWIKVGYKFTKKPVEVDVDNDSDDTVEDESLEAPGVVDRTAKNGQVETEQHISDNRPFMERISPFNMYVDPDAHNLDEARWIAQRVRRSVADVKVDPRYDAKARKAVKASAWKNLSGDADDNPHDEDTKSIPYVDVFEFYDIKTNRMCTFAAHQEMDEGQQRQFLISPKKIPYAFGHPFSMVRDYEIPDFFYPMGELEQIESLQHELNETRTAQMNHRRRNVRKYLIDDSRFDQRGKDALKSDVDNTIVPVLGSENPTTAIADMPQTGISADIYNMSEVIQGDIRQVAATTDFAQTEIRRTATESAIMQDQQNARATDKLSAIEGSIADIGARVIMLMQQFLTGKHVARIAGSQAVPIWIRYDKDYIKGEFDFEVEGGSTQPRNESFRRQSALQFMDIMAPLLGTVVNPAEVARKVLNDFGIKDADRFLIEQEPPQQQAEMGALPAGAPPGPDAGPQPAVPADMGQMGPVSAPEGGGGMQGLEGLMAQLQTQMGADVGL